MLAGWVVAAAVLATLEVDLTPEMAAGRFDPQRDAVGVRGAMAPLSWQKPVLAQALGGGRYRAQVQFERVPYGGQPVQYKFRIERPGQGPDEGWEPGRNHALFLEGPAPTVVRRFGVEAPALPPRRTGRIDELGLVGSRHVTPRRVQVWLPPGYDSQSQRRYPVLILHDGQNVFDARAAGAEWQVDETAQRLAAAGEIEPPLIVAVDSGADRVLDYTPTAVRLSSDRGGDGQRAVGGGAPAYARFLAEELKPLIDARYRTLPGAAHTAVGGSSLGGLVSLWLSLRHGDRFGAALVVSPSVWWDDGLAQREALAWTGAARPRVWLDMGAHEGVEALPAVRSVHEALQRRGWQGAELAYVEDPDGSHDEASWAARVEGMLKFLYARSAAAPARKPRPARTTERMASHPWCFTKRRPLPSAGVRRDYRARQRRGSPSRIFRTLPGLPALWIPS